MAFSVNNISSAFGGSATVKDGDIVPEVTTDEVGFKGLNNDKKARVFSTSWPADAPPPGYASLLSIASAHGLYATASPDALVIGKTSDLRKCIYDEKAAEDIRDCDPIHTIPHSRLAQVAFSSSENCLVVSEERSAEILAYSTSQLAAKQSNVALKLSTNAPIRIVAPNPDPRSAQFFALVSADDQLLLADLQAGQLTSGANGPVLADGVTCVTWSNKGKQLIAGRRDGTALILKIDASTVATVPKPTSVPANCHVASISWTENDVFFIVWTPSDVPADEPPVSEYFVVKTNKERSDFIFHKFDPEPLFASVADRTPAHFHVSRLRSYAHLDQLLMLSGTINPELSMIVKLSQSKECPNDYTIIMPKHDVQRASLPFLEDGSADSTPIGMAVDLSDDKGIVDPIIDDAEILDSELPVPELAALNQEGVLCMWAIIYPEAIRAKTPYPGFAEIDSIRKTISPANAKDMGPTPVVNQDSGHSGLPVPEPAQRTTMEDAQTTAPTMGMDNSKSPFGQQTPASGASGFGNGGGFGQTSTIGGGKTASSWTAGGFTSTTQTQQSGSGFGQPAFGNAPQLGTGSKPAFGQTGAVGSMGHAGGTSPAFGQTGFGARPSGPAFGQTGFGAQSGQSSGFGASTSGSSPFANAGTKTTSGFGAFANQNGFGAANNTNKSASPFGQPSTSSSGFGQTGQAGASPFGQATGQSAFGKPTGSSPFGGTSKSSGFGTGSGFGTTSSSLGQPGKFQLDSTFTKDETSKDVDDKPDSGNGFGFGGLGNMLGGGSKAQLSPSKEEEMEDDDGSTTEVEAPKKPQETPPSTINQPKTATTPHVSSLFGASQPQDKTPQAQQTLSTGWGFGNVPSTTPKDTPAPSKTIFGTKPTSEQTPALVSTSEPIQPFAPFGTIPSQREIKRPESEESEEEDDKSDVPDASLPPDPFSKPGYQTGDTSASSINDTSGEPGDAPPAPEFTPANKNAAHSIRTEGSELPPETISSGFSGSGEDITGDVSPAEDSEDEEDEEDDEEQEQEAPVGTSPESSFGNATDRSPQASPTGGRFTKVNVEQPKPRPLFGEQLPAGPIFAPPKPEESPRSPSPQRKPARTSLLQSPARSSSAPVGPEFVRRKQESAALAAKAREEELAQERARAEAARKAQHEAEAHETQPLVDDEDEVLRASLAEPIEPKEDLDPFIPKRPVDAFDSFDDGRTDIPSQIGKLYRNINDMVITFGINARSLSQFMMFQTEQAPAEHWPGVLASDTPNDALTEQWFLGDIDRLQAGYDTLDQILDSLSIKDVFQKLDDCQHLLTKEVGDLKGRITALRRTTQARMQPGDAMNAPLSAEQSSIQADLRKSSAAVLTQLASVEENLTVLRAKIAELSPQSQNGESSPFAFANPAKKRPTVEAVMNTVTKMTSMAERKSADVDVLVSQLKQLNVKNTKGVTTERPKTPERQIKGRAVTPSSAKSEAGSVYHTPSSEISMSRAGSVKGTGTPAKGVVVVSLEDRERWKGKAGRRKELAGLLKGVLVEKEKRAQRVQ